MVELSGLAAILNVRRPRETESNAFYRIRLAHLIVESANHVRAKAKVHQRKNSHYDVKQKCLINHENVLHYHENQHQNPDVL